jgi:hypothetical protein
VSDQQCQRRPRVVCLCGSTRFYNEFQEANFRETLAGRIVLTVGFYTHARAEAHGQGVGITPEQKDMLDWLHLHKIDLADEILVLNVGGYVGESTRREIAYAQANSKAVRWLEPPADDDYEREQLRIAHDQDAPEFVPHDDECGHDPATCYRCFLEEA